MGKTKKALDELDEHFKGEKERSPVERGVILRSPNQHQLQYSIHSAKVSWCPYCQEHFYNETNKTHTSEATKEHSHEVGKAR